MPSTTSTSNVSGDTESEDFDIPAKPPTPNPWAYETPLQYAVNHVFLPVELPHRSDYHPVEKDLSLARTACDAAHAYSAHINEISEQAQWCRIAKMLDNLQASVQSEHPDRDVIISQLRGLQTGDILTFFIRPQNAAIILTRQEDCTLYESFELSPSSGATDKTAGPLICSYPRSAIETSNEVFDNADFRLEFATFLSRPGAGVIDSDLPFHSQWTTALLTGIIRSVGRAVDVPHVTKRVRGHVSPSKSRHRDTRFLGTLFDHHEPRGMGADLPKLTYWNRSPLWLLIRVAMQMSVDRSPLGRASYKRFMLFVICTLAGEVHRDSTKLSNELLHLMSSKILRRLSKLGSPTPNWLSELALKTCTRLREILDDRWRILSTRVSPFRNPSQEELVRDTQLSLLQSHEYISSALADPGDKPASTPFQPSHDRRGTLEDFLSSDRGFFQEAYAADPDIALYDVEQSVEEGMDDWVSCVIDVDEACVQLEVLMDRYMMGASWRRKLNPEDTSVTMLTAIELFVALDKLVVKEIPILADYSPEIPIAFLEKLLLRKSTSLHRISRIYQYLSARYSQSHPGWSVLSDHFTADSFPVRYYDQSPYLHQLKARIEQDAITDARASLPLESTSFADTYRLSDSPLPASPLQAKAVIFELQSPAWLRIWRSAAPRILFYFYKFFPEDALLDQEEVNNLLVLVPQLQRYFVKCPGPLPYIQMQCVYLRSVGLESQLEDSTLHYAFQHPCRYAQAEITLSRWWPMNFYDNKKSSYHLEYQLGRHNDCLSCRDLEKYVVSTSHTPNDVLSAQADCPPDLSLDEFITFAHLRSGGSLQWVNMLHGLRSRTLNLRRHQVHFLLAQAASQVGPLDSNTGEWIWHQELQDSSFCNNLLDELCSLFVDVGACSFNGLMMNTISLLLTRVLASSPAEDVSERAAKLLQRVRNTAFRWVQELSYDLTQAPMNEERRTLLRDMAATCRSTFDVDPTTLRNLVRSPEDVDALLSCASFIEALRPEFIRDEHSRLLLERDRRLSVLLERILMDAILADASDRGIDLAVGKVFASYLPSVHKWEPLQHPNARWLTCRAEETMDQASLMVHLNLLDGELRVEGEALGVLPNDIMEVPEWQQIFRDQGFFVIPSNLPGMEFTTFGMMSKYKVHFTLRGRSMVIRARCNQTGHVLELIPSHILTEDLPPSLIEDHVHWLNLSAKVIEIRPLSQVWEQSSEHWSIDCSSGQYRMHKGHETLVDNRSPTWKMVSKCFECLNRGVDRPYLSGARHDDLLVTLRPISSPQSEPVFRLCITLPRYSLSFCVNEEEELESLDFKDMVYDEDQCIETLFGLQNLLVLRQKIHLAKELIFRRVLIPNGSPGRHGDDQVRVDFTLPKSDEPLYHAYDVDTEMGCLTGNGILISVNYLACLHSKTSHHRPDPLTHKTGAQAALDLLQSAGSRSFMMLEGQFRDSRQGDYSMRYPQNNSVHMENQRGCGNVYVRWRENVSEKRAARRAAYLFPWSTIAPSSLEDCDDVGRDCATTEELHVELEEVISAAASAVYQWSLNEPTMTAISTWVDMWGGNEPVPDYVQALIIEVQDILEKTTGSSLRFQLLFLLLTTAYCSPSQQGQQDAFLSMLITFSEHSQAHLPTSPSPIHADCESSDGYRPTEQAIWSRVFWCFQFKKRCLGQNPEEHSSDAIITQLLKDWPSDHTPFVDSLETCCWRKGSLTASLRPYFNSCYRNFTIKERLVRHILVERIPSCQASSLPYLSNEHIPPRITLNHLFSTRLAPELPIRNTFRLNNHKASSDDSDLPALDQLFSSLRTDRSFQRKYLARLDTSARCVRREVSVKEAAAKDLVEELKQHHAECRARYADALAILNGSLGPTIDPHEQVLEQFGQWPPITTAVLLRYLASTSPTSIPEQWKKCLVSLALLLLELQRTRRMLRFALDGHEEELSKELQNEVCDGWNAEEYPDWLLIQIQGNFGIRRVQAETAMELISPQSGRNTVVQLNMGEGKSSVIIPIAAAALADGNQLVRVVVPKALTVQMFDLLVSRLGGLVNRPIYCLPFSRNFQLEYGSNKATSSHVDYVREFMARCMAEHGILLVQPEHIISLKLMSVEQQMHTCNLAADPVPRLQKLIYKHIATPDTLCQLLPKGSFVGNLFRWVGQSSIRAESHKPDSARTGRKDERKDDTRGIPDSDTASKWLSLEGWIRSHARDILDESDEILHTRFQLMYTTGAQQHMDGYPDRWIITQQVLGIVKERAHTLSRNYPDSVEYERGPPGSFPHIRIVRASDVGQYLTSLIIEGVMAGRLSNFDFRNVSADLQDAIRGFISDEHVLQVPETTKKVEEYAKRCDQNYLWSGLLLLRGLLASNILLFSLAERRWRVDYGLQVLEESTHLNHSQTSKMLAVPYRAKDVPALNTQFGHPDITIILTCLSYYYAGLTEEQLRVSFEILQDQDDPPAEYAHWIEEYDGDAMPLPDSLQKLGEINLRSSEQWDKVIFPLFSRNKAAVDLYLSRIVFPKKAKEFPWKLSGSSWDLAEKRERPITGFSGTHDGRWLLPMSITQRDLDHQLGTDARVLAYLLQPENDFYMVTRENGERQTTREFLDVVAAQDPRIRVLLDVGAQILDLSNRQVAQAWLSIVPDIAGAVYFNEKDELMILMQNGVNLPMLSSPLSQRLDRCVVYLDHAHTRGTDIKFPIGSRAAVTLGPKVTKDRLVQGCMRMRKLGHGHSVMFFAPLEVDQSIRVVVAKKDPDIRVNAADVLCWAIRETWTDIEQRAPHWAQQGMAHKSRYDALSRFCENKITSKQLSDAWLQQECKSLADLYAPSDDAPSALSVLDPGIRQRCKDLGVLSLPRAQMEEEQEREVNREAERERDVELPPKAVPEKHFLHPDVVTFVKTGVIPPLHRGSAFRPIFTTLGKLSGEADVWSPSILATVDFCRTIKPDSTLGTMDQYLRPVQWILSHIKGHDQVLVLLSPFEADRLVPDIRVSEHVHLHVYAPRTSQRMKSCDNLRFYSIPPLPSDWNPPWALIDQLNVFAGQLYLRDYTSYLRLCRFLGIPTNEASEDVTVRRNTLHIPGSFEEEEITFSESPLPTVKALLAIRNRGLPFAHTHMGTLFQGKPLTKEDF